MNVVKLAKKLVEINSENPPGNEKDVAYYIRDFLRENGFSPRLLKIRDRRYDLVLKIDGERDGLMLNGHMDTVPIGSGWKYKQGEIKNGRLYGRGSVDMKGGLAALLSAFTKVKDFRKSVLLAFVADEESGFLGSSYLVKKKNLFKGIKYGLIAEPTDFKIQIAQKGVLELKYKFYGRAAHGSMPQLGINAILKANEAINKIKQYSRKIKKRKNKILGSPTVNIGTIRGGTKVNVVPDYCEFEVDRRIVPNENVSSVEEEMRNLVKGIGKMERKIGRNAMFIDEETKIIKTIKKITNAKTFGTPGYTEAEIYFREAGIQTAVFGPGKEEMCHITNENINIRDLERGEKVFKKIIEAMIC